MTAVYYECGWHCATDYAAFVDAYGYEMWASPAWPVLKAIRMPRMITWLVNSATDEPARVEQLRLRPVTLRDGTAPAGWDGFWLRRRLGRPVWRCAAAPSTGRPYHPQVGGGPGEHPDVLRDPLGPLERRFAERAGAR